MAPKRCLPTEKDRSCKNPDCEYYGKIGGIVKIGKSGENDYFRCRKCRRGYSATYGTIFRRKKQRPKGT